MPWKPPLEAAGTTCYGIELNPAHDDVAIARWQSFTGEDAVLAETGESFASLKAKRLTPRPCRAARR